MRTSRRLPVSEHQSAREPIAIAGVGASAGGFEALRQLFAALPDGLGMALVLSQHLDPMHPDLTAELFAEQSAMRVRQAADGMQLEAATIYLVPPGTYASLDGNVLRLAQPAARRPFDHFLNSLAQERGEDAICIMVSGAGGDGDAGAAAIRQTGGTVLVCGASEAGYGGMPQPAIETGTADRVFSVEVIAAYLVGRCSQGAAASDQPAARDLAANTQIQETMPERQRNISDDLRDILDGAGIATLFLDGKLTIRFFSRGATALFPIIASDIGRPLGDLAFFAKDTTLLADARAVIDDLQPRAREIEADDGAWYIRRIHPYRTGSDRAEGVVVTFTDISEIKRAGREIQAMRAYSDSMIETVRQPLVVLDERFRIVSANRAFYRVFAAEPEAAVGQPFPAVAECAEDAGPRGFLERVRSGDAPDEGCECDFSVPTLGRRTMLLNAHRIEEGLLGPDRILLAIDDITERKQAAAALDAARRQAERASAAKSRFLAAASHDLRQPLQTISFVQELLTRKLDDREAERLLARLDETVNAMTRILDTLLNVNQLEAGVVAPEPADFAIGTVLEQLRTEFALHAAAHGLGWRVMPSRMRVRSDPRLLEQILRNLLSNAVKYTREGRVLLGCRRRGGMLRIEVWDTGIGIAQEHIAEIFEEFRQLENPARDRAKGLGLGLAIVHRLADLLHHRVDVRSLPGRGSVFAVEVPISVATAIGEARPPPPARPDGAARRDLVLIVEDDRAVREMLGILLGAEGYRTVVAADGAEANDLVRDGLMRPDIVVADYNLPNGPSGVDLVAALRRRFRREIPAILLSGDIAAGTLREIANQGCIHLTKPVKPADLAQVIRDMLGERPRSAPATLHAPTVCVVDDDYETREAIRDLLADEGRAVALFDSGEAFLDGYDPGGNDCLVIDVRLPGMSGLELLERLARAGHHPPVIMVTGHGEVSMAVAAMKAGAVDFVEKPVDSRALLASIDRALDRSRNAAERPQLRDAAVHRLAVLSPRERQVLDRVLAGQPSKIIAADLGISQRTVENHRAAIMKKTGTGSLAELIRVALAAAV